jgi:hypothetical protein
VPFITSNSSCLCFDFLVFAGAGTLAGGFPVSLLDFLRASVVGFAFLIRDHPRKSAVRFAFPDPVRCRRFMVVGCCFSDHPINQW